MKNLHLILIVIFLLQACNDKKSLTQTSAEKTVEVVDSVNVHANNDSVALLQLTKDLYIWHESSKTADFNPLLKNETDTVYSEIDIKEHKQTWNKLQKTNLFSDVFLKNYNAIALKINEGLKNKSMIWNVGELPPFGYGANPWCNCQDRPDDFADKIWIMQLQINNNTASYNWSWGNGLVYRIKAVKNEDKWLIDYMEGFDYNDFVNSFQQANNFTGKWQGGIVSLSIGETSLAFLYHGQCVYFYPVKKLSNAEFEMIWARDMDCKFDNGTAETFNLKEVPEIGKPFAKFTLKNNTLQAVYYYKKWVAAYTSKIQDRVFVDEYSRMQ